MVGMGGVGGFYGSKLLQGGQEVIALARGPILKALQKQELKIKSYQGDFAVKHQAVEHVIDLSPPDLIILAVKTYDTDHALDQIAPIVADSTLLLSLQNGVESEQKMIARFGPENVLGAICYIGAEITKPGHLTHSADGAVTIGEMDSRDTDRLKQLYKMFQRCGIDIHISSDIQKTLWNKLLWNVPFNQVCTIARVTVGEALDSRELTELLRDTGREVVAIAKKHNISLNEESIEKHIHFSQQELRAVRPSMLQDLEKGKRLEHETFGGFIVREGNRLDIPTPVNETLYRFLCSLDPGAY